MAVPAGRFNHVPLLTGTTRDEGTFFAPLLFPNLGPDGYVAALTTHFGAHAAAVAQRYPLEEHGGSAMQAMAAIMTDLDWAWLQRAADRQFAGKISLYAYEFSTARHRRFPSSRPVSNRSPHTAPSCGTCSTCAPATYG